MLLIVNAGSSSLKTALYSGDNLDVPRSTVSVEGIGTGKATLLPDGRFDEATIRRVEAGDHTAAVALVRDWFQAEVPELDVAAIGYRVVHGGERFRGPARLDDDAVDYLRAISHLAPNHMPGAIKCIDAFRTVYPAVAHVACFDTSFFAELPELARTLPIPREIAAEGIRRYGFHGISYEYLLRSLAEHEGEAAAHGRVIFAHLGSGCSLAAVSDGRPVDTTMGFTPVSGIPMSTRTGDIEPGFLLYLLRDKGMSVEEVADIVTRRSGLLGISGDTADMYYLLQDQATKPAAALAVDFFCYAIRKQIGAYAAALGGLDTIVFAGGIGERSAELRGRILEGLDFLGVMVDDEPNKANARLISAPGSRVGVHVIPTREDYMIATHTMTILKENTP